MQQAGTLMAVPVRLSRTALMGLVVILVTFGGLVAWSTLAPLSSAAVAHGSVVVDSNRKDVQHLEGGTVKTILARDGDHVGAGQVVIELSDSRITANLEALKSLMLINQAQRARLRAERDDAAEITFPEELTSRNSPTVRTILADQRQLFQARRTAFESRRASLINQRDQSDALEQGLKERIKAQQERIALTRQELVGIASLAAKGYAPTRRVLELNRAIAELEGELADLQSRDVGALKDSQHAMLEVQRIDDDFQEGVESDLQANAKDRYELIQRIQTLSEQLTRLKVTAPVAGTVVGSTVHTVGGVIAPGATLMEIVPEDDPLVVEARVRPVDIEDLALGMPAELRFPGLESRLLPQLKGEIINISADQIQDAERGGAYFAVRVKVDDQSLKLLGTTNLRPGMPVDVMLIKQQRTVVQYLLGPLGDFLSRAMRE